MTCATCGSANAVENCYRCDSWICEECAQDYEGYYVCQICYGEMTGESYEGEDFDDDLDLEGDESEEESGEDDGDEEDDEDYL